MGNILRAWAWMFGNRHPKWRKRNGVIYFTVVSNGWTGEQWIRYFKEGLNREYLEFLKEIGAEITPVGVLEGMLRSPHFKPTNGAKIEVAVLPWWLFSDADRITSKILVEGKRRGFFRPNAEIACLTRQMFRDPDIAKMVGAGDIMVVSDPISDEVAKPGGDIVLNSYSIFGHGEPSFLCTSSSCEGENLDSYSARPSIKWSHKNGFLFGSRVLS